MAAISKEHLVFLETISAIAETNPFTADRPRLESLLLKKPVPDEQLNLSNWQTRLKSAVEVTEKLDECLREVKPNICQEKPDPLIQELYRTGVWFYAYHKHIPGLDQHVQECAKEPEKDLTLDPEVYSSFRNKIKEFLDISHSTAPNESILVMNESEVADLFAFCFQLRRGMSGILKNLIGCSTSAARLRAQVWEAIFTRRLLWSFKYVKNRMANFSTLILGPSGTGKELVARAIGTSQFIPYQPKENRFSINFMRAYQTANLSALTPTLIESELFGHAKGAFTGATSTRKGLLEECSPHGALFLDEIGELSLEIQVKLLRVLQTREIQPLGGGRKAFFEGRILSATNRDIPTLLEAGTLREDFLYRLGSVVIRVPTLAQRIHECPEEMDELLHHILRQVLGSEDPFVYQDLKGRIKPLIDSDYPWPGNVREFEQCIRSMIITSEYIPLAAPTHSTRELDTLFNKMENIQVSLEEVLQEYCTYAYRREPNFTNIAHKLQADWRTIKKYVKE